MGPIKKLLKSIKIIQLVAILCTIFYVGINTYKLTDCRVRFAPNKHENAFGYCSGHVKVYFSVTTSIGYFFSTSITTNS